MKKIYSLILILGITLSCLLLTACNSETIINFKGIEIFVANANSKNEYDITYLSIDIIDNGNITKLYQKENPSYKITKPNKSYEETFFAPNISNILKTKSNKFVLIVNLTIKDGNKEYNLNSIDTILIIKKENDITLRNEKYKNTILSDIANYQFNIDNNEKENLTLHFNYSQIKN